MNENTIRELTNEAIDRIDGGNIVSDLDDFFGQNAPVASVVSLPLPFGDDFNG